MSFAIIHVSDQPVAPSLAFTEPTVAGSNPLTMTCQDVAAVMVPAFTASICFR